MEHSSGFQWRDVDDVTPEEINVQCKYAK